MRYHRRPELIDADAADVLLDLAEGAIRDGLAGTSTIVPSLEALPPAAARCAGSFVTLHVDGELNGCIGAIVSREPLARDVVHHARAAAFDDPRLPPLRPADLPLLDIEISVLTPPSPVAAHTRRELLANLRPGIDGLVIGSGRHRAVYLPSVWEMLPDPEVFVRQLLVKAGLDPATWPGDLVAETFRSDGFSRSSGDGHPT